MTFSLAEHRLCRMEAPVERLRDPSRFPELEGKAKEAPVNARDVESDLADRRERYVEGLKDKSLETLRSELKGLTTRAATTYRGHMDAVLARRDKGVSTPVTGLASPATRLKAEFLILLVQDHCRALYDKAGKKIDPAITEAIGALAPLGIALRASERDGKLSIYESTSQAKVQYIHAERARELIDVRKEIGKTSDETELRRLRSREEQLVNELAGAGIPTSDAALPAVLSDLTLGARYLDIFGERTPAAPPRRAPAKIEKAKDARSDKEVKESIAGAGKALAKETRSYMESYVKRMKTEPGKRPLSADILEEKKYRIATQKALATIAADGQELAARMAASKDGDDRAARRVEIETLMEGVRAASKTLGTDVQFTLSGNEFRLLVNVYDHRYMAQHVPMLERLKEVRRLRATARGDRAAALRKEQAELEEWAASVGYPAADGTLDATLKDMRLAADFYALDPERAYEDSWSAVREGLKLGKLPSTKQLADLNWAVNALYCLSHVGTGETPREAADKRMHEMTVACFRMGYRLVMAPGTTPEEEEKAEKENKPSRRWALSVRKLVLNDERNEAEEEILGSRILLEEYEKMSRSGDVNQMVRGNLGKRRLDEGHGALRAFLKEREAAGEVNPERVLSHRMHSLVGLFEEWRLPNDAEVKALMQDIDARSKQVLSSGDKKQLAYVESQMKAVNEKLLPHGFELRIAEGKETVKDGEKGTKEVDIRFISLVDPPLALRAVRTRMNKEIKSAEGDKKEGLQAALTLYLRRRGDEAAMDEFVKHAAPMVDVDPQAEDYEEKVDAFSKAKDALSKRAKAITDPLERGRFWARLGAVARLKGYRVMRYGYDEKEVITLAKPE